MATYKTSWVQRLIDNVWTKTFAFAHAKTVYTDYENGKTLDKSLEEINEENTQQSTEMMDIKMLGWSVPRECPIQNEVNGDKFIQKVGRVDLGSLAWSYDASSGHERFKSTTALIRLPESNSVTANIYTNGYTTSSADDVYSHKNDKSISIGAGSTLAVYDSAYTDATAFKEAMQGRYLYYELATPITTTIDGNEIGETISDVRKETTVNLLNPTLQTTTQSGVTCTNNGDGTFTINGTSSDKIASRFRLQTNIIENLQGLLPLKLVGNVPDSNVIFQYSNFSNESFYDKGNGVIITKAFDSATFDKACINIEVKSGDTANNVVVKPMLTTNLNATIDEFVPYTGDTGSLNGDVADLRSDVDGMGVAHKHSFFETVEVTVNNNDYIYDFYLADGYSFDDLLGGNNCGLAMVYINNGSAIKNSYGMSLLLSINPKIDSSMIGMVYGRTTGPGMNITNVEYVSSGSKKGFRVYGHATFSAVDALKSLYTTVASWTNICNM